MVVQTLTVDREQERRDAERRYAESALHNVESENHPTNILARRYLALLAEVEQAERERDGWKEAADWHASEHDRLLGMDK